MNMEETTTDPEDNVDQAWIDRRFQAWRTGFNQRMCSSKDGGGNGENHVPRMDTNNNGPALLSSSTSVKAVRVKQEIVDDVSSHVLDEDKISFPVKNETTSASLLWQAALDAVNSSSSNASGGSSPKTPSQLLEYGINLCEAWMAAVVKYMLDNHVAINCSSLKEWATVCYSNAINLMSQFGDLETTTTLPCFKSWFDEFIIGSMMARRREVKRVLEFMQNILQAKCHDDAFCYEWVTKCKTLQNVCDFLIEDDLNELVTIKAVLAESSYPLLKRKRAAEYYACIELVRTFEAKMRGALEAAVCLPQDLALERLSEEVKLEIESQKTLDEVGKMSEVLKGRVIQVMEEVRLKVAQQNQRLVQSEKLVVAKALKYVKDRYGMALQAGPSSAHSTLKKAHSELVKVYLKAYSDVNLFVFTDIWDHGVVRQELDEVYKEVEKKLAARDAESAKRTGVVTLTKTSLRNTSPTSSSETTSTSSKTKSPRSSAEGTSTFLPKPSFEWTSANIASISQPRSSLERTASYVSSLSPPRRSSLDTAHSSILMKRPEDTFSDVSDSSYKQGSVQLSDTSDFEEGTPRSTTSESAANTCGVAMTVMNNGLVQEGFLKYCKKWDRLNIASACFKTNQLLKFDHPKTATIHTIPPIKPYNEEILSLQFSVIAKKLEEQQTDPTKKPLVFAVPTVVTSLARRRLKTAATLAGLSTSMFIQTTTAIMVGYAHDYRQVMKKYNVIIYIEDGLIEVAIFNLTGGKCCQLATAKCQKPFRVEEIAVSGIVQNAVALVTCAAKSARLPVDNIEAGAVTTSLPLRKRHQGIVTEHNHLDIDIRKGIKDGLTSLGCRQDMYFRIRNFATILTGARLISEEGAEYNRSELYHEVCPWSVQLSYGTTEALLLTVNQSMEDVNERVRSRFLVADTLTVSRLEMDDKVFVENIIKCKAEHQDSNAYIQVDADQQGLITIRPCDLWEELLKTQVKCMPLDSFTRKKAEKKLEHLHRAFKGATKGIYDGVKRPNQGPMEGGHPKVSRWDE